MELITEIFPLKLKIRLKLFEAATIQTTANKAITVMQLIFFWYCPKPVKLTNVHFNLV